MTETNAVYDLGKKPTVPLEQFKPVLLALGHLDEMLLYELIFGTRTDVDRVVSTLRQGCQATYNQMLNGPPPNPQGVLQISPEQRIKARAEIVLKIFANVEKPSRPQQQCIDMANAVLDYCNGTLARIPAAGNGD